MFGAVFKRFARVAIFFACAGSLQFCFLNPQPEPPESSRGRPSGGTGGSGGTTGGGGAGGIIVADAGIPPIDPAADVRTDTTVGSTDAGADGPDGDALPPDDDGPSLDAEVSGDDAPSRDADAAGEDADAPGEDAPGTDVDDAQGEPDGHSDAPDGHGPDATD